ncbi:hypothetical protein [Rubripirellula reticaptiva]|uniref:Uncharacterized protein n=1 Tax=Rubripirellula reticaptiva TaxID=2528013 RepID=A0A5C6EM07_9BACT|nr:hypothetical protein [Rubripirellula reticaptiva]TWU49384.1 hypothetical protein Poly59_39990 [Rubripirellula reticaptiva]
MTTNRRTKTDTKTKRKTESKSLRFCKGLSIALSAAVLVWTFWSVLGSPQVTPVVEKRLPVDPVTQVTYQQSDAQYIFDSAVQTDREFMTQLTVKRQAQASVVKPGIEHSRQVWSAKKKRVQHQIDSLAKEPEGSLARKYHDELVAAQQAEDDGPI